MFLKKINAGEKESLRQKIIRDIKEGIVIQKTKEQIDEDLRKKMIEDIKKGELKTPC